MIKEYVYSENLILPDKPGKIAVHYTDRPLEIYPVKYSLQSYFIKMCNESSNSGKISKITIEWNEDEEKNKSLLEIIKPKSLF
jgi:hypothetical protein